MKIRKILLAACAALFAGGAAAESIDLGRGELPVTVPQGYDDSSPAPLVVLLHGYTSSGANHDSYMGFSEIADRYGFLLVAPDGTVEESENRSRFWNATEVCCNFYGAEIDDSAYVASIIEEMKSQYSVDANRVYLVGHSNGGFMSFTMAYEHSGTIAAIASLAGANHLEEREPPPNGVHILQIHGTGDTVIEYAGGEIQGNRYPGAVSTVQRWASYNGCLMDGAGRELRDLDASLPGHESGTYLFEAGCKAGGSAELWTIPAGAHSPILSDTFAEQVIEWLLAHPKTRGESG